MKNGRPQLKDIDNAWFLEHAVAETDHKDRGTLLYRDVCRAGGYDFHLVELKALNLEKRGLVRCEDSYCWLTKKGWELLEQRGVDVSDPHWK